MTDEQEEDPEGQEQNYEKSVISNDESEEK